MTRRMIEIDGLKLALSDSGGAGRPIVLQHGLTADAGQIAEFFPGSPDWRVLTLECRGHGSSETGDPAAFSIAAFADDVAAAMAAAGVSRAVVGGVSMGAAIACRLAVIRPDLVEALVLIRPAWVVDAAPENMAPNAEVGELITRFGAGAGLAAFERSATAARLAEVAPDNLASLKSMFGRVPADVTAALTTRISADGPGISAEQLRGVVVPALIVGTKRDAIHPLGLAETLASSLPNARFAEITPKASSKPAYLADLAAAIDRFLSDLTRDVTP
ncbi:MAG: alpha/beta hydrolase [Ancalomicrobiaceae bacterium]|nr:alpha/beta hydrolase [Ancalomicrobiaceae bacterium]